MRKKQCVSALLETQRTSTQRRHFYVYRITGEWFRQIDGHAFGKSEHAEVQLGVVLDSLALLIFESIPLDDINIPLCET